MIKRRKEFIEVGYYLSKYGLSDPPERLNTNSWKQAYQIFFEQLNDGREVLSFEHSLKNSRDSFDSHFPATKRKGWKEKDGSPRHLKGLDLKVYNKFKNLTEAEVWDQISKYANLNAKQYDKIFDDLIAIEESEQQENKHLKTEGGLKVYISKKVERDPSLRNDAFKEHGYDCMVCEFNFEERYGEWGKDWAEVHHLIPLSQNREEKRQTNPKTDLAILCANCHRMVHRKKGIVLTVEELKSKLKCL